MITTKKLKAANWVCYECGVTYGRWYQGSVYSGPSMHCSTHHVGKCDVCDKTEVSVTEPRDYGGLKLNVTK
jgi:hypothetical protein